MALGWPRVDYLGTVNETLPSAETRPFTRLGALLVMIGGGIFLFGSTEELWHATGIFALAEPMNPLSALCLMGCGASLLMSARWRAASLALAATVLIAALAWLAGYLFDMDHYSELELISSSLADTRMAPNAALAFVLCSSSIIAMDWSRTARYVAQLLAVGALLISLLALTGYLSEAVSFARIGRSMAAMSLPTALLLGLLSVSLIVWRPKEGFLGILDAPGSGGGLARSLIPAVIGIPLVLHVMRLAGETAGWFSPGFGLALFTVLNIMAFTYLVFEAAAKLEETDLARAASERSRTLFFANMSHELRTPLTAVLGYAESLLDWHPKREHDEMVKTIIASGDHLLAIINQILDIAKLEAGRLEIEEKDCSLSELLNDVRGIVALKAAEKRLDFRIDLSGSVPEVLRTDPMRIKQVLINLTMNAVKFTSKGSVKIEVSYDAPRRYLTFKVKDSGIGIPLEQQKRLFQAFRQGDRSIYGRYGGSGLGLAISRELARKLGGDITVRSVPGKGSEFTFTIHHRHPGRAFVTELPLRPFDRIQEISVPRFRGTVFLADDNLVNRALIEQWLSATGVIVETADTGNEVLERCASREYDLLMIDVKMPGTDGVEVARSLRASGYGKPIVIVTASGNKEDIASYEAAGVSGYLLKPFKREVFHSMLGRFLERIGGEATAIAGTVGPEHFGKLVSRFLATVDECMAKIEEAYERKSFAEMQRSAHRLVPAGMFGFPELSIAAQDMEETLAKVAQLQQKLETLREKARAATAPESAA